MKKLFKKFANDKADSILVIFIISLPLVMLVMGFVVNINKNINVKNAYNSMAQTSVETAIKSVGPSGSLDSTSVTRFVNEYRNQSSPSAYHTNETQVYDSKNCSTVEVDGVKHKAPYMVVKLQTGRSSSDKGVSATATWTIEGKTAKPDARTLSNATSYKVISADVYSSSTNTFDMFGLPSCQTIKSSVSAISFGNNSDAQ